MKTSTIIDVSTFLLIPFIALFLYYLISLYCFSSEVKQVFGNSTKAALYVPYTITDIYSHEMLKNANFEFDLLYGFFGGRQTLSEPLSMLVGDESEEKLSELRRNVKIRSCPYGWETHEKLLYKEFFVFYVLTFAIYSFLLWTSCRDIVLNQLLLFTPLLFTLFSIISYVFLEGYFIRIEFHILFYNVIGMINAIIACSFCAIYHRLRN